MEAIGYMNTQKSRAQTATRSYNNEENFKVNKLQYSQSCWRNTAKAINLLKKLLSLRLMQKEELGTFTQNFL